jgi:sugar/nucleoside kinase (ribokinase family)
MGQLHSGVPLRDALRTANRVASAVVSVRGARLTDAEFAAALA